MYKNKIYSKYFSLHIKELYGEIKENKIRQFFPVLKYYFEEYLPEDRNVKIADLGCGAGEFVYWLNNIGYSDVTGVDISNELILKGHSIGINNIINEDIFEFLIRSENNFEVFVLRDVLEHFEKEDILKLIGLLYLSLKKNGRVILQVPNGQSPFLGKIFFGDFTHETPFTKSSLSQIFLAAGFRYIKIKEAGPVPKGIISSIRYVLWQIIKFGYRFRQGIATGDTNGLFTQNLIAIVIK
jgi:2-polyprenyl-3-methyl-5-hydroxy-6-metoxy-1,4-benzoquinol methylase